MTRLIVTCILQEIKKILVSILLAIGIAVNFTSFATPAEAVYVNGYYRSNGTYVNGYYRSRANAYTYDNYSYKYPSYSNGYGYNDSYYNGYSYSNDWYTPSYYDDDYYYGKSYYDLNNDY